MYSVLEHKASMDRTYLSTKGLCKGIDTLVVISMRADSGHAKGVHPKALVKFRGKSDLASIVYLQQKMLLS